MYFIQVLAVDEDKGDNRKISYMFHKEDDAEISQLFSVDEASGYISVKSSLVFAGTLSLS